jgi:GNAT superfamily N-acetyltransferase
MDDGAGAIVIRALRPDDHRAWLGLWQGYQHFYEARIAPEVTARSWDRLLDPDGPLHGLAALAGGEMVGFAHYLFHPSSWTTGDYCYLQDLFVAEAARGRGVARALIEAASEAANAAGAARLYWLTHESNGPARALYDRLATRSGFIQYRR